MRTDRALLLLLPLLLFLAASAAHAQRPRGGDFQINSKTAGTQSLPDVDTAADGSFVVVWKEGSEYEDLTKPIFIKARLFDAAGRPRSSEIRVARVKPFRYDLPASGPRVSMAPDGRFVVVWGGGVEDPNLGFGQRFAADGRPLGKRFRLGRSNTLGQREPDVAMAPDGSFVVAWYQLEVGGTSEVPLDVYIRHFGPNGRPRGPEQLAIGGFDEQSEPRLAMNANGDLVLTSQIWDGNFYRVAASQSGAGYFIVDDGLDWGGVLNQSVAIAPDGRFAVAWGDRRSDFRQDSSLENDEDWYGIGIRFFAADGTPLTSELHANTFVRGIQTAPEVSVLRNGGFLLAWSSGADQDGDGSGIFARAYGPDGQPRGPEFPVNVGRSGSQTNPAIAIAPNGKGVVVWVGPDEEGAGIFARLLRLAR